MADPIDPGNRKLMDYLFEKKEEVPNEIYVTLSNMIQQKEKNREDTNKYYKIKYSLTEVIAIAYRGFDEEGDERLELAMKHKTRNHEAILRKLKSGERTHTCFFDDILDGYAPMHIDTRGETYPTGATFAKTELLSPGHDGNYFYNPGKITRTMNIISCVEFDPLK